MCAPLTEFPDPYCRKLIILNLEVICHQIIYFFFFQAYTGSQRTRSSRKLGESHNANLRTLGVLYPLLVIEGQGAHPQASGIRKQVGVCSADAGHWGGLEYVGR